MHQELLRELSVITEEEQKILDGRQEIDPQIYTEKKDMVIDSGKLLQRGKLIQVRPHTRFVHFPEHTHNYIEVIYMCQGSTTHILNGREVVLKQGDLLFLNQNAVQEILPAGKDDIAVNFIILPEFLDTAFEMMGKEENQLRDFLVGALCGRDGETGWMYFHVADILPVQNLIENMVWTIFYDSSSFYSSFWTAWTRWSPAGGSLIMRSQLRCSVISGSIIRTGLSPSWRSRWDMMYTG